MRYHCHTGHAYTATALLTEQTTKIEETMWTALRRLEERKNLLITLAQDQPSAAAEYATGYAADQATLSQVHIDRIRAILLNDKVTITGVPT